jgi:hypothetical protein
MATQWEYDTSRLCIEDIYNLPDSGLVRAKEFMNELGLQGWEIFRIDAMMLGTVQHIVYTCKRPI